MTYKFATDAASVSEGRVLDSEDPCNITFDVFVADEEEEEEEEVELEEGQVRIMGVACVRSVVRVTDFADDIKGTSTEAREVAKVRPCRERAN